MRLDSTGTWQSTGRLNSRNRTPGSEHVQRTLLADPQPTSVFRARAQGSPTLGEHFQEDGSPYKDLVDYCQTADLNPIDTTILWGENQLCCQQKAKSYLDQPGRDGFVLIIA